MGTSVRVLPDRIAAVSVGVLWGRKNRAPQPELLPATELGVAIVDVAGPEPVIVKRYLLEDADLNLSADHLVDLGLPVVGFNLLRFDWLSLESRTDVAPLILRTIDIYSALYLQVRDVVDAEGASGFPMRGEYGVLNPHRLAETNLGFVPGPGDDAIGDAELAAALWHHFVTTERAIIAGRSYWLEQEQLDLLCGASPQFDSYASWKTAAMERPEPKPYRRRDRHQITFPRVDQRYV